MYTREELLDRIEVAKRNIKTAKTQLKRLEKARMIYSEMECDNTFGFDMPIGDISSGYGFWKHMNEVISEWTANLKRYKKMLRLLDKVNAMEE